MCRALFALLMAAGCGSGGGGTTPDAADVAGDGGCPRPAACEPFGEGGDEAFFDPTEAATQLVYTRYGAAEAPYDYVAVEVYGRLGGPSAPGTFTFDGTGYADCGLCGTGARACSGGACERSFLACSGTLVVTELPTAAGGVFAGSVADLVLREVTIDDASGTSSVVPGGETWCVAGFSFRVETAAFP